MLTLQPVHLFVQGCSLKDGCPREGGHSTAPGNVCRHLQVAFKAKLRPVAVLDDPVAFLGPTLKNVVKKFST